MYRLISFFTIVPSLCTTGLSNEEKENKFRILKDAYIAEAQRIGSGKTEEEVVKNALIQLGYEEITSCKMGQLFILFLQDDVSEVEQRKRVEEMCNNQIVNTILYDFKVEPYNEKVI